MAAQTLYDKLWQSHLVQQRDDGTALIYIDLQLIHEVTSPQAFEGLRLANRKPSGKSAWRASPVSQTPCRAYRSRPWTTTVTALACLNSR